MEAITLSREVLEWAAKKAGLTLESFAHEISNRDVTRQRIADGVMTPPQIEKLAKRARVPFGYLFLPNPPDLPKASIPDLRQTQDPLPLSEDFYEVLEDVSAKQTWYIDYLTERGARALEFVGKFKGTTLKSYNDVVDDMRKVLGITDLDRSRSPDPPAYFSRLSAKAEASGVLVIKSSFVKSATRRGLSEREFRGFAISHPLAPLVFVNGKDAEVAAVFTLVHELAHIWLGVSGVSDVSPKNNSNIERICNAIAGEILVPMADFEKRWEKQGEEVTALAKHYRVSRLVIARRALDRGFVDQAFYERVLHASKAVKRDGAPTALITIPIRNSKKFTHTIVAEAMSGQVMLREAARLLNVKPDTVVALGKGRDSDG
ncbi:ImmA/IrrE family metallo-endopeptidase [Luteimonas sp. SMYT11W]|uniref:ImmA/IrrE family metallo-endopeptidase n=1 Tax=Luteimonas flava TaxID=3115822 RepID=A0ABU7WGU3_9GAMM